MIIDMHSHILPRSYLDLVERDPQAARATLTRNEAGELFIKPQNYALPLGAGPFGPELYEVDAKLRAMDEAGVDVAAISTPTILFFYWTEPEEGLRFARLVNDGIAAVCRARPDRFAGLATLPLQAPDLAIAELERATQELGLKGIEIGTSVNGLDLDRPDLLPFFERVQALDVPIFIHPNAGAIARERVSKFYFENTIAFMLETALAISSLIFSGVLERFPDLRLWFAHGGGFTPYQLARLDHARAVRPECADLPRPPSEYFRRLYFDSLTHSPQALAYLISLVGSDHVMLGTDHPFDMGQDHPLDFVGSVPGLSQADRAAILGGNAARLLGIGDRSGD